MVLGLEASWRSRRCTSLVLYRSTGYSQGASSDSPCRNRRVLSSNGEGGRATLLRRWNVSRRSRVSQYFQLSPQRGRGSSNTFERRNHCMTGLTAGIRGVIIVDGPLFARCFACFRLCEIVSRYGRVTVTIVVLQVSMATNRSLFAFTCSGAKESIGKTVKTRKR